MIRVTVTAVKVTSPPTARRARGDYCRQECSLLCEHPETCAAIRARNSVIEKYFYVVPRVASAMMRTLPPFIQLADLISYGAVGLVRAADSYASDRSVPFEAYASVLVRGAIIDELRSQDWAPRSLRRRQRLYTRAIAQAEGDLGRDPSVDEVAQFWGVQPDDVRRIELDISMSYPVTLESAEAEMSASADVFADVIPTFVRKAALETIQSMPILHRTVMAYHYYLGHTLSTTAALVGVSPARAGAVHGEVIEAVLDAVLHAVDTTVWTSDAQSEGT